MGVDSQFFLKLADERRLGRLARLDLAARKLPGAGKVLSGRALGNEDATVAIDECGSRDEQDGQAGLDRRRGAGIGHSVFLNRPAPDFPQFSGEGLGTMRTLLRRVRGETAGATTVEYGLIGALVVIGSIGAYSALGDSLKTSFAGASGCMKAASGDRGECPQLP